ncbi:MAG: HAD family hydrolase [Promethearchaeota archaeon]
MKGVIFDFDLTLADSSKGVVECVNHALKKLNFTEVSEREVSKTIGHSLEQTFMMLSGSHDKTKIRKFKSYFIEKADMVMANLTEIYSEIPKIIKLLKNNGFKLGIVSTKFRYRIETILARENLLNFFDVIIGGEDVQNLKPHPSGLLLAVKHLNLHNSEVVYVGDSVIDSETAFRAGTYFIAVLSGVTPRIAFNRSQVSWFLENLSELPNLLGIK